jgi:alanine racemase
MGRIGFLPDESLEVIKKLYFFNKRVKIKGICTHFSDSSSEVKHYTIYQAELFQRLLDQLIHVKINIPIIHASNSAAIINYPEFQFNCVRPGLLLYGISPFEYNLDLKPALSLISKIITIKNIKTNSFLSYNRTYQTKRSSRIALVPIGYADGFSEKLSNKGQVIIRNKRYPIVGSICMNQFLVDITDGENIQYNDRVTIIGGDINESISIKELSKTSSLIPYEILCRLSEDLPRIYTNI